MKDSESKWLLFPKVTNQLRLKGSVREKKKMLETRTTAQVPSVRSDFLWAAEEKQALAQRTDRPNVTASLKLGALP